jgi:hypothetical protein
VLPLAWVGRPTVHGGDVDEWELGRFWDRVECTGVVTAEVDAVMLCGCGDGSVLFREILENAVAMVMTKSCQTVRMGNSMQYEMRTTMLSDFELIWSALEALEADR